MLWLPGARPSDGEWSMMAGAERWKSSGEELVHWRPAKEQRGVGSRETRGRSWTVTEALRLVVMELKREIDEEVLARARVAGRRMREWHLADGGGCGCGCGRAGKMS